MEKIMENVFKLFIRGVVSACLLFVPLDVLLPLLIHTPLDYAFYHPLIHYQRIIFWILFLYTSISEIFFKKNVNEGVLVGSCACGLAGFGFLMSSAAFKADLLDLLLIALVMAIGVSVCWQIASDETNLMEVAEAS